MSSSSVSSHGAPFAAMLRGALVPSAAVGALTVVAMVLWRGLSAWPGALLGYSVSLAFFASGMLLLSRLVRSASPGAFLAVGMAVYLGQVLLLGLFLILFIDAPWLDGKAFGVTALVVTLCWQAFGMRAMRRARVPVYDLREE